MTAVSVLGFPVRKVPDKTMKDILSGGIDKMNEAGAAIIGGHSINDSEIKAGFAVTGMIDQDKIVTNAGARPGDVLVLTKPLGTGIVAFASQIGRALGDSGDSQSYIRTVRGRGFQFVGEIVIETKPVPSQQEKGEPRSINAFQRLVDLLDEEQDIPILAPVIQREIFYRLLVGEQGGRLRQLAVMGTQSQQVARAVSWLKSNFTKPLRVDELSKIANMGTSTFHHHFRSMTALSPLQYQKQLRLQEARRLMLTEHIDAASAGFQVGYESPSQFSREYSRLYGAPPVRDITNLRQQAANTNV